MQPGPGEHVGDPLGAHQRKGGPQPGHEVAGEVRKAVHGDRHPDERLFARLVKALHPVPDRHCRDQKPLRGLLGGPATRCPQRQDGEPLWRRVVRPVAGRDPTETRVLDPELLAQQRDLGAKAVVLGDEPDARNPAIDAPAPDGNDGDPRQINGAKHAGAGDRGPVDGQAMRGCKRWGHGDGGGAEARQSLREVMNLSGDRHGQERARRTTATTPQSTRHTPPPSARRPRSGRRPDKGEVGAAKPRRVGATLFENGGEAVGRKHALGVALEGGLVGGGDADRRCSGARTARTRTPSPRRSGAARSRAGRGAAGRGQGRRTTPPRPLARRDRGPRRSPSAGRSAAPRSRPRARRRHA